jgi:hypothetical protein
MKLWELSAVARVPSASQVVDLEERHPVSSVDCFETRGRAVGQTDAPTKLKCCNAGSEARVGAVERDGNQMGCTYTLESSRNQFSWLRGTDQKVL